MNCRNCQEQLYPANPEIGCTIRGRHLKSLCHGCSNSVGGSPRRDPEELTARLTFLEEHDEPVDRHMRYNLQQLTGKVNYLQSKLSEHLKPREQKPKPGLRPL